VGDKAYSTVFDNAKLRNLVPDFKATVPFSAGIQETVAWFDADRPPGDRRGSKRTLGSPRAVYGEALSGQPAGDRVARPQSWFYWRCHFRLGRLVAGVRLIHPPRPRRSEAVRLDDSITSDNFASAIETQVSAQPNRDEACRPVPSPRRSEAHVGDVADSFVALSWS